MIKVISSMAEPVDSVEVPSPKIKGFLMPKSLALCADLLYETRQLRLDMDKQVAEMKSKETMLRQHLIDNLPVSDATGVAGKVARATIVTKEEPVAKNWDETFEYVRKKKAFFLLQKRLNTTAIKEVWANGKQIPGVGKIIVKSVSLNKVK